MNQATELSIGQQLNKVDHLMSANGERMWAALPSHITPDRMRRVALTCLRKNPKLLECTPASLLGAISEAATYGWELGGVLGHAYLVPYKDEAVMIPGYKGLLDLCHRSGQLADVQPPTVVREGDEFDYLLGDQPFVRHKPARDPKRFERPITDVYWVVNLRSGGTVRLVRSINEIRAHRDQYSQSYRRAEEYRRQCEGRGQQPDPQRLSAWHTAEEAMAGKTLIREAINRGLIPMSSEFRTLAGREQTAETQIVEASTASLDDEVLGTAPPPKAIQAAADRTADCGDAAGTAGSTTATIGDARSTPGLLEALRFELGNAEQLLDCQTIGETFLDRCTDNAQRLAVAAAVTRRQDDIRQARGE